MTEMQFRALLGCGLMLALAFLVCVGTVAWSTRQQPAAKPAPQPAPVQPQPSVILTCDCEAGMTAVQPSTFVQIDGISHVIHRDSICHEHNPTCICGPRPGLAPFGPLLIHNPLTTA